MLQKYTYVIIFLSSLLVLSCGAKNSLYLPQTPDKVANTQAM
jgi:hypothetical protein